MAEKLKFVKQKTILLVDDDPLIIRMYQNRLTRDGYKILLAFNGEEAIAELKKTKPDLIFLDLMMPRMNGVETLKILKKDALAKKIPVIILTNLGDRQEDIEKAKKMGALDYLVKAKVSLKELSARAEKAIRKI